MSGGDTVGAPPASTLGSRVDSVAALYRDMAGTLTRRVARLGLSHHDAEDVVADAFAALWRMDAERYAELDNPGAYVWTVARHLAYRAGATAGKVSAASHEVLERWAGVVHDVDPVTRMETASLSRAALRALPIEQQRVLWDSLVEGRSVRAVADELGLSVTNVTTRAQRARMALRQAYVLEYLRLATRTCGFDEVALARTVLGTASLRQERALDEHLLDCAECRRLLADATDEMRSTRTNGVVAIGALGLGWLTQAPPGPPALTSEGLAADGLPASSGPPARTGLARLCMAVGVAFAVVMPGLCVTTGAIMARNEPRGGVTEVAGPGLGVDVSASPEQVRLTMPAPGRHERWDVEVVSHTETPAGLAVVVLDASGRARDPLSSGEPGEEALLAFEVDGNRVGEPRPVSSWEGQMLYLGQLDAHGAMNVVATASRRPDDTDTGLSARLTVRFVASADGAMAAEPGQFLPMPAGSLDMLPRTGGGLSVLVLGVLTLGAGGALVAWGRRGVRSP